MLQSPLAKSSPFYLSFKSVRLKFSGGGEAGVVTPSRPPPPTNNFFLYPPPILRCFWKEWTPPPPSHPTSSIFHFHCFLFILGHNCFICSLQGLKNEVTFPPYASVNSKLQHSPGLTHGKFFKVVKLPVPRQKICAIKITALGKKGKIPGPQGQFCGPSTV